MKNFKKLIKEAHLGNPLNEGFKDYLGYSESKMPSQEEVDKFFSDTQNEMHYLNSKPVMGQEGDIVRSEIEPWDEYDLSNWNALVKKAELSEATDFNDPALIKSRAAQMKRDKIEADEKDKQAYLDKKYGSSFMDKLEAEIDLKNELANLEDEREDVLRNMEEEAEPEGGEIADDYGSILNDMDAKIAAIKSDLDDLRMYESVNEAEEGNTTFFYPSEKIFSRKYDVINLLPYEFKGGNRANAVDGLTILTVTSTDPDRHAQKYGTPSDKEVEAYKMVDKALWNFKRTIPSMAYDKYDFYRYGNGAASDMGFVYSPKNGFEFYLNIPREIRQPDEYGNVPQEDIDVFDKITSGMMEIANKVEAMGFKTSLNSTPEGYKGSLNEEFKVGDKVTYLGHPAVVTATQEYNGRDFVSVSYDKGKGATKARNILATSGDVKAVNEETDTDVGGGAKQDNELNLNISNANDIADEEEANSGVVGETKGFDFKKMVKEALTPKNLR